MTAHVPRVEIMFKKGCHGCYSVFFRLKLKKIEVVCNVTPLGMTGWCYQLFCCGRFSGGTLRGCEFGRMANLHSHTLFLPPDLPFPAHKPFFFESELSTFGKGKEMEHTHAVDDHLQHLCGKLTQRRGAWHSDEDLLRKSAKIPVCWLQAFFFWTMAFSQVQEFHRLRCGHCVFCHHISVIIFII